MEYDATFGPDLPETYKINNVILRFQPVIIGIVGLCQGNYTLSVMPYDSYTRQLGFKDETGDAYSTITEDVAGFDRAFKKSNRITKDTTVCCRWRGH